MFNDNPENFFKQGGELRGKVSMPQLLNAALLAETKLINGNKPINVEELDKPIAVKSEETTV